MLKLIGAVLVMAACIGYAQGLLGQLIRHRDILRSCCELTDLLAGEIRYERIPMAEAFCRIHGKLCPELAEILLVIAENLDKGDFASMEEIWNQSFTAKKQQLLLTEEELEEVKDIGKNLGFLDFDVQVNHLAGCRERLGRNLALLQQELEEKRKLYRSLSLAAGIFVILILF